MSCEMRYVRGKRKYRDLVEDQFLNETTDVEIKRKT